MVLQSFRILSVTFSRSMVSNVSISESKLEAPWPGAGCPSLGMPCAGSAFGACFPWDGGICDAGFVADPTGVTGGLCSGTGGTFCGAVGRGADTVVAGAEGAGFGAVFTGAAGAAKCDTAGGFFTGSCWTVS